MAQHFTNLISAFTAEFIDETNPSNLEFYCGTTFYKSYQRLHCRVHCETNPSRLEFYCGTTFYKSYQRLHCRVHCQTNPSWLEFYCGTTFYKSYQRLHCRVHCRDKYKLVRVLLWHNILQILSAPSLPS